MRKVYSGIKLIGIFKGFKRFTDFVYLVERIGDFYFLVFF